MRFFVKKTTLFLFFLLQYYTLLLNSVFQMSRINISINAKTEAASKEYADSAKLKFSNLVELALEDYLKARGFIHGDELADFLDEIREMAAHGCKIKKMREMLTPVFVKELS